MEGIWKRIIVDDQKTQLDNYIVQSFNSIKKALDSLGKTNGGICISQVCRGIRKTAFGFKWEYM